ncbi:MAG TPA: hypothetical protein VFS44_06735 [Gemmatimonadaceae bacterium]|nr:hypothetical protein [Gemmatimonadaceae bacterium]
MHLRALLPLPLLLLACGRPAPPAATPPRADFLVVAGDSTFWVHAGPQGVHARGSPLELARWGGKFYEVYVVDDDRSYTDAEIVGEQLWRRDLVTGDSLLVFRDTTIRGIERWYARAHPDDRPLGPDEDLEPDPHVSATSELDLLDRFGHYTSYEYAADLTVSEGDEWHVRRRGVVDLRDGRHPSLAELFGARTAASLVRKGSALFAQERDSVLASRDSDDARVREAAGAIGDFQFDSTSFDLVAMNGEPAVEFVVPGRGSRAGGIVLPLPPVKVAIPAWWDRARDGLPTSEDSAGARWRRDGYQVLARDAGDDGVRLSLEDAHGHAWPVARMPAPVRSIYWLDAGRADSTTLRALARAFDEAALYDEETRTAMAAPRPPTFLPAARAWRARGAE